MSASTPECKCRPGITVLAGHAHEHMCPMFQARVEEPAGEPYDYFPGEANELVGDTAVERVARSANAEREGEASVPDALTEATRALLADALNKADLALQEVSRWDEHQPGEALPAKALELVADAWRAVYAANVDRYMTWEPLHAEARREPAQPLAVPLVGDETEALPAPVPFGQDSPTYMELLGERGRLLARVAGLEAREAELRSALAAIRAIAVMAQNERAKDFRQSWLREIEDRARASLSGADCGGSGP